LLWVPWDILIIRSFGIEESEMVAIGSHFESKIQDDGTIRTEEVTDYKGGTEGFYVLLLFLFFPLWIAPYFLYLLLSYHAALYSKCPKEVVRAYNKTKKQHPLIKIPVSETKQYQRRKADYDKKVNKIQQKYSVYGRDYVQQKIDSLPMPLFHISINNNDHYIVEINKYKNLVFFLYRENYGHGDLKGMITRNASPVYIGEIDWLEIWNVTASYETLQNLDMYIKHLYQ